jgi:hypothetical protein
MKVIKRVVLVIGMLTGCMLLMGCTSEVACHDKILIISIDSSTEFMCDRGAKIEFMPLIPISGTRIMLTCKCPTISPFNSGMSSEDVVPIPQERK